MNDFANNQKSHDYYSQLSSGNVSNNYNNFLNNLQSTTTGQVAQNEQQLTNKVSNANSAYQAGIAQISSEFDRKAEASTAIRDDLLEAGGSIVAVKAMGKAAKTIKEKLKGTERGGETEEGESLEDSARGGEDVSGQGTELTETPARSKTDDFGEDRDYTESKDAPDEETKEETMQQEEKGMDVGDEAPTEMAEAPTEVTNPMQGGDVEMADRSFDSAPRAIGEEDSGSEIAKQYEESGKGADSEMSEMGETKAGESRALDSDVGADEGLGRTTHGVDAAEEPSTGASSDWQAGGDIADDFTDTGVFASEGAEAGGEVAATSLGEAASAGISATLDTIGEGIAVAGGFVDPVTDILGGAVLLAGVGYGIWDALSGKKNREKHEAHKQEKAAQADDNAQAQAQAQAGAENKEAQSSSRAAAARQANIVSNVRSNLSNNNHNAVTVGVSTGRKEY
tara:strand:+ start:6982 stop:8340 length:1359 start_codon:yes stop_codon:yes gene_type:complete